MNIIPLQLRRLFILGFLFGYLAPANAQTPMLALPLEKRWERQADWVELQDLDGRFRLETPASMQTKVDTLDTGLGQQVFHTFFLKVPDPATADNVIYALSYVDYPPGALHHDSTELVQELLMASEEEAAAAVGGEVIYAADKDINGYPGRQWRIDYNGGKASARTLAGVAGSRYYEMKVFSLESSGPNKSADKFFDSLRLYRPPGEAVTAEPEK
ncbi:hypothetical protein [Lewinella sp. W8]|uniref:hypothetical protein n=1 Tax=Lewinella sp. W8 TaxID=2528208 RepID=UPI0010676AF3|nr:hypothetical protein [Lewinella sp. W8]MTB51908.1 hypothetical protein [Lewinella sp. W8]